jgi:hypothetical protein
VGTTAPLAGMFLRININGTNYRIPLTVG